MSGGRRSRGPVYLDLHRPRTERDLACRDDPARFRRRLRRLRKILQRPRSVAVPTEGIAWLDTAPPSDADNRSLVIFDRGDEVEVNAARMVFDSLLWQTIGMSP